MTKSRDNLTIDELLRDPLTRSLMKADRVDPSALEAVLRSLALVIGSAAGRSASPFDCGGAEGLRRALGRLQDQTSRCLAVGRHVRAQLCGAP